MEDLTKQQLILLTLLLSFVTSIGTGIITVSLIGEAPETVTQTINRVVEKTIETVTPTKETIKETETQTQVVVEKDAAVTSAIEKASKSLVRIYTVDGEAKKFFAIGVVVDGDGTVVATVSGYVDGFKYAGAYADGTEYELKVATDYESGKNTVVLTPVKEEGDNKTFTVAEVVTPDTLKLGQSVINIGGDKDTSVQTGRISSLPKEKTADSVEYISGVVTDISSATAGSVITNYSGAIVGYNAYVLNLQQQKTFITASELVVSKAEESDDPPTNNNP